MKERHPLPLMIKAAFEFRSNRSLHRFVKGEKGGIGRYADQMTKVAWRCDTGMR
jgi:hypothetical protein